MVAANLPSVQFRVNGVETRFDVLTYDMATRRFVALEANRIWEDFTVHHGDQQFRESRSQAPGADETRRYVSVTVTDSNLSELEDWLDEQGDWRSAWKLRALYPETFYYDHDALHRRIARFLAQFV